MNVSIKNLGAIRTGVFDFEKKISVFAGVNNTGKTYMSYIIDALCSNTVSLRREYFQLVSWSELASQNKTTIDIDLELLNQLLKERLAQVRENLASIFGISEDHANKLFADLQISIERLPIQEDLILPLEIKQAFDSLLHFELIKEKDTLSATLALTSNRNLITDKGDQTLASAFIASSLYNAILDYFIPKAIIFPVERIAIPTFKTELLLQRSQLVDTMLKISDNSDFSAITDMLQQNAKRYPNAIRDSLNMTNDLNEYQKDKSSFYETAVEIERQLLHGEVSTDKNNDIVFAHRQGGHKIPVHISASIVKSFASIIFFLKHLAQPGQLIIIDEPEMNLHPEGQRLFVQLMTQLANKGLSFLISTHSDYIIREISNTILDTRYRPDQAAHPLLEEDVAVYNFAYTDDSLVDMAPVSFGSYGYEIPSLNAAIDAQNAFFDELLEHTDSHG